MLSNNKVDYPYRSKEQKTLGLVSRQSNRGSFCTSWLPTKSRSVWMKMNRLPFRALLNSSVQLMITSDLLASARSKLVKFWGSWPKNVSNVFSRFAARSRWWTTWPSTGERLVKNSLNFSSWDQTTIADKFTQVNVLVEMTAQEWSYKPFKFCLTPAYFFIRLWVTLLDYLFKIAIRALSIV